MKQINFRVDEEVFEILKIISTQLNETIPNLSKRLILDNIRELRKEIALKGYQEEKLSLKTAWKISGLSFLEFNNLLVKKNIEPPIPEELDDKLIEIALKIEENDIFKADKG